jgi:polar amino acid transport system permease protein
MSTPPHTPDSFAVLLPFRVTPTRMAARISPLSTALLCFCGVMAASSAWSASGTAVLSPLDVIIKWAPLLLTGFAFNIAISLLAMLLGTFAGLWLGLALLSEFRPVASVAWFVTQVFRNAPWLVLLFFVMFLVPFQVIIFKTNIPLPDWQKATVGFALPVMANVAEVVRGAVRSIPSTQWEAAESLSFTRRQTMWLIILPQCVKRMLPPWMNIYSLVTMSTVLASIVGVSEMLTLTAQVHAAEGGRPELFAPLYGFALLCFFLYCYPINLWTAHLERRFHVH